MSVSALWSEVIPYPHTGISRVDLLFRGQVVDRDIAWSTANVTETWATGVRWQLAITLPQNDGIVEGAEIRPYSGLSYGSGEPELLPLGVFPVLTIDDSDDPTDDMSLTLSDRWLWVVKAKFQGPRASNAGTLIIDQIVKLLMETGRFPTVNVTATSAARMTQQVWDDGPHPVIVDLCKAIGAEAYCDENGIPTIRNRPAVGAPVATYANGEGGTRIRLGRTRSIEPVVNVVTVVCSNSDPAFKFAPQTAKITDPGSPIHPSRPEIGILSITLTDPNLRYASEALAMAHKELSRRSAPARVYKITAVPDVSRRVGETVAFLDPDGVSQTAQLQQLTHPLGVQESQDLDTVSTRPDEDSGL